MALKHSTPLIGLPSFLSRVGTRVPVPRPRLAASRPRKADTARPPTPKDSISSHSRLRRHSGTLTPSAHGMVGVCLFQESEPRQSRKPALLCGIRCGCSGEGRVIVQLSSRPGLFFNRDMQCCIRIGPRRHRARHLLSVRPFGTGTGTDTGRPIHRGLHKLP
ncbi:hypothetical protein LZ31DRAFT_317600 [Colletotrichum somersetense]|nr:hypothetical protein LZ31DRAFT_317600 [Colletotrichum somersetense]